MGEKTILHFSVQGEYITNLARERYYEDHNLSGAIKLVQSCTMTDDLNASQHFLLALEIISGEKKIVGTYPGDDYKVVDDDGALDFSTFIEEVDEMENKVKQYKDDYEALMQKYLFVVNSLEDYHLRIIADDYRSEYGEYLFEKEERYSPSSNDTCSTNTGILDEYLTRMKVARDDDYGWLEPNGTYHPVEWGNHSEWAGEYAETHYPYRNNTVLYWKTDANGIRHHYVGGDFLVYVLGWVLLDSPMQGIASPKYDETRGLSKKQKEFLFDYYIDRGLNERASALYNED